MDLKINTASNDEVATICKALGVIATLVATKGMREPAEWYKERDLEKTEPVRRAPIDLIFELASVLGVGCYDEPPPFGLTVSLEDEERDGLGGKLPYQSLLARELIRHMPAGNKVYVMGLDASSVEIMTRERALEGKEYNMVGVAIGSLTAPEWIFWRPCNYPLTSEGWLVLPSITSYSGDGTHKRTWSNFFGLKKGF